MTLEITHNGETLLLLDNVGDLVVPRDKRERSIVMSEIARALFLLTDAVIVPLDDDGEPPNPDGPNVLLFPGGKT